MVCLGEPIAVIGALTYNFLPFMVLPIYVSLEKMDRRLLEASARPVRLAVAILPQGHLAS